MAGDSPAGCTMNRPSKACGTGDVRPLTPTPLTIRHKTRYGQVGLGSSLRAGPWEICGTGMMSARAWNMRLSALTLIALSVGILHLKAQDEATHGRRTTGAGSGSHSATQTHIQYEFEAIRWDKLLKDMKAELNVDEPDINRVFDGPRRSVLFIACLGKTDRRYGVGKFRWDQRKIRRIELFEVGYDMNLVVKVEEYVEVKPPWGDWHVEDESSRGFVQLPSLGQVITGKFP